MPRSFWLGLFIVVTMAMLGVGVFLIGDRDFLFRSTFPVKAVFHNVSGLNVGADVRVGGIRAGTVQKIELPHGPDEEVTVVMTMLGDVHNLIRTDSVAAIKTAGLLGDEFIEVSIGSRTAAVVGSDAAIRSTTPMDVGELTNSVALQTKSALGAIQDDMEALKQNVLFRGFFSKRGYEDNADLTRHAIARLPGRQPAREFSYPALDLFDKPDSAKLRNARSLQDAGHFLEQTQVRQAVVAVSADRGDSERATALTQGRAVVVRDYLVQNFRLDDTRIKTIGLGKSVALGSGNDVKILVYP